MNKDKKSLSFWLAIFCGVLGAVQAACSFFDVTLEINLIAEGVAAVLTALVLLGVLKPKKDASMGETFEEIKKSVKNTLLTKEPTEQKTCDDEQLVRQIESETKEKREG